MTDSFDIRNGFASLSPSGQHPLRGAGGLLSLCSPAVCLPQAICLRLSPLHFDSAALRFAVLGSTFSISPARRLAVMNLALMADLHPLLTKRAGGRNISGLSAYEQ